MGNECCSKRGNKTGSSFSDEERKYLKTLYSDLIGPKRTKGKTKFNKSTMKDLFRENLDLAFGIYNFMVNAGKEGEVSYDVFELTVEVLTKDPGSFQLAEYRSYDKIDILALIMIGDFTLRKDELRTITVNYLQAIDFIKTLLKIFQYSVEVGTPVDEYAVRVVVDGAFKEEEGRLDWWHFINYLKENFIYINRYLRSYFTAKFLGKKVSLTIPSLSKASFLLNRDLTSLLYFSNIYMNTINQLQFVYSSRYNGLSFERIAETLENYDGPTYILFKVVPFEESSGKVGEENNYIIGGFSRIPWKNNGDYRGDSDCYIFSLTPKFKNYFTLAHPTANRNFIYLKTEGEYNVGLGFGGNKNNDFRIWIDGKDLNKSYVRSDDNTFSKGALVMPEPSYIKILEVEIWGFGTDFNVLEATSARQSVRANTGITYNQPKISALMEETADFGNTYQNNKQFCEPDGAYVTTERFTNKNKLYREINSISQSISPYKANTEGQQEQGRSQMASSRDFGDNGGVYNEGSVPKRNSAIGGSSISSKGEALGKVGPYQGRSSYTTTYEFHNPFQGDQVVNVTRTIPENR